MPSRLAPILSATLALLALLAGCGEPPPDAPPTVYVVLEGGDPTYPSPPPVVDPPASAPELDGGPVALPDVDPPADRPGDCSTFVAAGARYSTVIDDADVLDDGNDCTFDACEDGEPVHTPRPAGTPCASNGGAFCTAGGSCVECLNGGHCPSPLSCREGMCVPQHCMDVVLSSDEEGIDCGGVDCPPCL